MTVPVHHIAIATTRLQTMALFYQSLPGLAFQDWKTNLSGERRSAWFAAGKVLIMLEAKTVARGPEALIFQLTPEINLDDLLELPLESASECTVYFRDPDGNRLGYSSYPDPLPLRLTHAATDRTWLHVRESQLE